jgi:hypothetical protein
MQLTNSKWFLPLFAVFLGCAMLAAQAAGGHLSDGFFSLGLMVALAVLLLVGGRSETIRGLRGDGRDERFRQIDIHATAIAGTAVISAVIIGFLVEMAKGHSGSPFTWLGAIGGLTYLAAIIIMRIRG